MFWNAAAARVYLIDDQAVADAPGVVVIDPTDNSVEAEISIGGETRGMGFFDDCNNFSVMQANGVLEQFDSNTNTSFCNLDLSSVANYKIQIVTVAALGKMYVPRYVVDGEVAVVQAPSC